MFGWGGPLLVVIDLILEQIKLYWILQKGQSQRINVLMPNNKYLIMANCELLHCSIQMDNSQQFFYKKMSDFSWKKSGFRLGNVRKLVMAKECEIFIILITK